MTDEEAIDKLKMWYSMMNSVENPDNIHLDNMAVILTAIQALEQRSCVWEIAYERGKVEVLDKIRAEIANHCGLLKQNHCRYCSYCNSVMGVREITEVIDKHKPESEGKE